MAHNSCSTKNGRKKVDHNGKKFFDSMKNSSAVIYDYQTNMFVMTDYWGKNVLFYQITL